MRALQKPICPLAPSKKIFNLSKALFFGSPRLKLDVLRDVLSSTGVAPAETVFVGDSINDCRAATRAGVPFVARIGMHGPRMPPGGMHEELHSSPGWPRIKSLDELLTFLQRRVEG